MASSAREPASIGSIGGVIFKIIFVFTSAQAIPARFAAILSSASLWDSEERITARTASHLPLMHINLEVCGMRGLLEEYELWM